MKTSRTIRRISVRVVCLAGAICIALYALAHPTAGWNCTILSVTAMAPMVFAIAAFFGDRAPAPFRAGFATGCGSYFLLYFLLSGAGAYQSSGPATHPSFDSLATTKAIFLLHDKVFFRNSTVRLVGSADNDYDSAPYPGSHASSGGAFQVPDVKSAKSDSAAPVGLNGPAANFDLDETAAENFQQIGHCVWAWIFGISAGTFAHCLASRRLRDRGKPTPPNGSLPNSAITTPAPS